jgi:hypothetical protein
MALAVAQAQSAQGSSGGAATTPALTTTSGNLIVAIITNNAGAWGATPISDSKGNTWTQVNLDTTSSPSRIGVYYAKNITGGASHTFSAAAIASIFVSIAIIEISGASATAPFTTGEQALGPRQTTTTYTGTTYTTATANSILIGGCVHDDSNDAITAGTITPGTYTIPTNGSKPDGTTLEPVAIAYLIVSATTTAAGAKFTLASAATGGVTAAAFVQAAAVAASGVPTTSRRTDRWNPARAWMGLR